MQGRCWKGEFWKLDFLNGFQDYILVWLKQLPNIETMSKGDFVVRVNILTVNKSQILETVDFMKQEERRQHTTGEKWQA